MKPRFHALLCTRDEDDIISDSLDHFASWADKVFVLDTGSVDRTREIIKQKATENPRIRFFDHPPFWFSDQMRGYLFSLARSEMEDGDWFLRVDTDERYHTAPPEFVATELKRYETCVYHQYFDFRLTSSEVARLDSREAVEAERQRPIEDRMHLYTVGDYSEPRMCRYRRAMMWPPTHTFPINAGFVARSRIPIRHYPHRDPIQMEKRVLLRKTMASAEVNAGLFSPRNHWFESDWKSHVIAPDDPRLLSWRPGEILHDPLFRNHLAPPPKRALQRMLHGLFVRQLDALRSKKKPAFDVQLVPESIQRALKDALSSAK